MKKKSVNAESIRGAKASVKTLAADVESAKKKLISIMKEPDLLRKTNNYIEASKHLIQIWIDLLDARIQLLEKMTEVLSEGMLAMLPKEPK